LIYEFARLASGLLAEINALVHPLIKGFCEFV